MPSIDTRAAIAVALVHSAGDASEHLRDALRDLGAQIVYDAETTRFDRDALMRSGATVVIVNLDPDDEEQGDAIDALLDDDRINVVFNDGAVSSKLSGYDLARWARHLAAKIIGEAELLPPRPEGAEAVPVRNMPQHRSTEANKPKSAEPPSVSDQALRETTDAIASALAAFDLHATKLEAKNAPKEPANELDGLLADFSLDPAPSLAPAPTSGDNPFADLELAFDLASEPEPVDSRPDLVDAPSTITDMQAMRKDFREPSESVMPAASVDEENPFRDLGFDFDFDRAPERTPKEVIPGLDEILANMPPTAAAAAGGASLGSTAGGASAPSKTRQDPATSKSSTDLRDFSALELAPESEPVVANDSLDSGSGSKPPRRFEINIDHLSLEPIEEERGPTDSFADRGMVSENVLHGPNASQKIRPETAEPAPTPSNVRPGEEFAFSLEEIDFTPTSRNQPDAGLANVDDDFFCEFAALTGENVVADGPDAVVESIGAIPRIWVLGASIGGPDAVREFLAAMPPTVAATFVLAQHMGADFVDLMVTQLQKATRLPVAIANPGMRVAHGQVLVVPVAGRLLIEPTGEVKVVAMDEVSPNSPSIDRVLIDVADRFGARAGAIIFSGMAHDAIEGAKYLASKGGQVWVQDPATCAVSSMIDGAIEAGIVGYIGKPADLAAEFVRRFGQH